MLTAVSVPAWAEESGQTEKTNKIHISSDNFTLNNELNTAEFFGNVVATQENSEIRSENLTITYKKNTGDTEKSNETAQSIEKMTATGNVRIKFDNHIATTDEAVYISEKKILTLNGPGSTVKSGDDFITGEKITFYRESGKVEVDSGLGQRVEAVFHSKESGLD